MKIILHHYKAINEEGERKTLSAMLIPSICIFSMRPFLHKALQGNTKRHRHYRT
jgi:hypothetical protein